MFRRMLVVIVATLVMSSSGGWTQVYDPHTGDPPSGSHVQFTSNEWKFVPTPDGKDVKGECRIDCYTDEYDQVFLTLKGLQKLSMYTVWMVNSDKGETERAGVSQHWNGDEANMFFFKSDQNGRGFYNGWLSKCPLGKWKYLEVRYHPNGNEKDIDRSVAIVRVRIKPQ